jgi:hypothetical protein
MSDITETWEAYEKSVLAFERALSAAMDLGVDSEPVYKFMIDEDLSVEKIGDYPELWEAWFRSNVLEIVNITRTSWATNEPTLDAVELLLAFGGPNVRLTVPMRFDTEWATLSVLWASESFEREIHIPQIADVLGVHAECFAPIS